MPEARTLKQVLMVPTGSHWEREKENNQKKRIIKPPLTDTTPEDKATGPRQNDKRQRWLALVAAFLE